MRRVAVIEEDALFARRMSRTLESENYEVEWYADREEGLAAVRRRTFDVVLIGIGDTAEGADVCRRIREEAMNPNVALMALTSNGDVHADALAAGADESILTTLSGRELLARLTSVLRRAAPTAVRERAAYDDSGLTIFPDAMRVVRSNGEQVFLSKGEADVLDLLLRHSPGSLSVERIRAELNATLPPVSRSAIEARLKSLRRKLGPDRISNRIGFGYSFNPQRKQRA